MSTLAENKTLKLINLESNYISAQGIITLLEAINVHQTISEFRVVNQVSAQFFPFLLLQWANKGYLYHEQ